MEAIFKYCHLVKLLIAPGHEVSHRAVRSEAREITNNDTRETIARKLKEVIADLDVNGFDVSAAHAQLALDSMQAVDDEGKDSGEH